MELLNTAGGRRLARLALVTAAAAALGSLSACGSGGSETPLIKTAVKVASITQQGNCEDVNIKITPVKLLPDPPKMSNTKEFVTPVKLTKGADNISCTGESQTIPMAPGNWRFTANLPSEIAICEREITQAGPNEVNFKDGETTCSAAPGRAADAAAAVPPAAPDAAAPATAPAAEPAPKP